MDHRTEITLADKAGFGQNDCVVWCQSENVVNNFHAELTTTEKLSKPLE